VIDDWECLDLAHRGDERAWRDLFERHYPPLVRMTSSITGSMETGHDLAQEAFVRLLNARISHHAGTFRSFLSTIAYHLALKERSRHISRPLSDPGLLADGAPSPLERVIRDETGRIIFGVIQSLPREQREILSLRLIAGHSYEEIAGITGIPIGTVKSRMFYGVKACRELLKERGVSR